MSLADLTRDAVLAEANEYDDVAVTLFCGDTASDLRGITSS